jgi:polysaccharide chain length determinant protein (PEP-CTERM system associated)
MTKETVMQLDTTTTSGFSLHDLVTLFLRKKAQFTLPFLLVFGLVTFYAFVAEAEYRSEARILIEPKGLQLGDQASVASFTEHRIQIISEQIMQRENMLQLIKDHDLYPELSLESLDKAIEQLEEAIDMKPVNTELVDPTTGRVRESTIAFLLAFEYTDAQVAKAVADNLVSLFLRKNEATRIADVEQTAGFLSQQVDRLAAQVAEREQALAKFKQENAGKLPETQDANLQILDRYERQLLEVAEELRSLREQAVFVEAELAQTSPTGMLIGTTGERILTNSEKIKTLRTELADAQRRYSANHPDVKRLKRQLEEARAGLNNEDAEFYAEDASAPDNPAYIQLQSKLKSINSSISALDRREASLNDKIRQYETSLTESPAIEREYLALTRDYENVLETYRETKRQLLDAQLSEAAEKGDQSDSFSILEVPRVPVDPVRPNRLAILVIGSILALIVGIVTVLVSDQMDRTVRHTRDLADLIGGAPLGVIGYIAVDADVRRRRLWWSAAAIFVLAVGFTAYYFMTDQEDMATPVSTGLVIDQHVRG